VFPKTKTSIFIHTTSYIKLETPERKNNKNMILLTKKGLLEKYYFDNHVLEKL